MEYINNGIKITSCKMPGSESGKLKKPRYRAQIKRK